MYLGNVKPRNCLPQSIQIYVFYNTVYYLEQQRLNDKQLFCTCGAQENSAD